MNTTFFEDFFVCKNYKISSKIGQKFKDIFAAKNLLWMKNYYNCHQKNIYYCFTL